MTSTRVRPLSPSRFVCAAAVALVLCAPLSAQDKASKADPAKGSQIAAQVCAACHASDGNSTISMNPKLAGLPAEYLAKQLNDFTKPSTDKSARVSAVMTPFAAALSPDDKRNVAAYFAGHKMKPGTAKNKQTEELGRRIYRTGIPEKAVAACAGCHGPNGAGIPAQFPRLGGQFAEYVEAQLVAFSEGSRRNSLPMTQIAARMSNAEMKAVADYIAGLR